MKIDTTGLEIDEVVERILRLADSVVAARQ